MFDSPLTVHVVSLHWAGTWKAVPPVPVPEIRGALSQAVLSSGAWWSP